MRNPSQLAAVLIALVLATALAALAWSAAPSPAPHPAPATGAPAVAPGGHPVAVPEGPGTSSSDPDKARIKEIDEQIRSLREQFKSQADPLQAQLKSLREKLDTDLKPLEDERRELVRRGESPALQQLDDDEAAQLAALADKEKADVEKVHQDYAQQRAALKASFDQKRRELRTGGK